MAKDSHLGLNLLPFLDEEKTAEEEKDSTKLIKSKELVATEKAILHFLNKLLFLEFRLECQLSFNKGLGKVA